MYSLDALMKMQLLDVFREVNSEICELSHIASQDRDCRHDGVCGEENIRILLKADQKNRDSPKKRNWKSHPV